MARTNKQAAEMGSKMPQRELSRAAALRAYGMIGVMGHDVSDAYGLVMDAADMEFDYESIEHAAQRMIDEVNELREAYSETPRSKQKVREEAADVLFMAINLCSFVGMHPLKTLYIANEKFHRRFQRVLKICEERGLDLAKLGKAHEGEQQAIWREAKEQLRAEDAKGDGA